MRERAHNEITDRLRGSWIASLSGVVLVLALCCPGCSREPAAATAGTPDVLARVGDSSILVADLETEVARRVAKGHPVPAKDELLDEMIATEAMVQRAQKDGIREDPDVRHEISRLIIGKWKDRELLPLLDAVQVSDAEVRAEYDQNIADYTQPAMVRLAALFLPLGPGASDAKREEVVGRMKEAREKALANPAPGGRGAAAGGFAALAITYSEHQASRYRGGDIGWLKEGAFSSRWPQEVQQVGFGLAKGRVSDVIEGDKGVYLVMKSDSREARVTAFEQVKAALRQKMVSGKRREIQKDFVADVVRDADPEVNRGALAAVTVSMKSAAIARAEKGDRPPRLPGRSE